MKRRHLRPALFRIGVIFVFIITYYGVHSIALARSTYAQTQPAPPSVPTEAPNWATLQAAELTRQATAHQATGNLDIATARFLEAIRFDATYGPAYLGLASLHELAGDHREAERVLTMGIDHIVDFADGYRSRASLRLRQHRASEAISDLEHATSLNRTDLSLLQELASAYVSQGAFPAALATTRRIAFLAATAKNTAVQSQAIKQAYALSLLVAEVDPVQAGRQGRGSVRNALARSITLTQRSSP